MKRTKSQVITLEFVMNTAIIIILITYTYMWSTGVFTDTVERTSVFFARKHARDICSKMERIVKYGGVIEYSFTMNGMLEVRRNKSSGRGYVEIRVALSRERENVRATERHPFFTIETVYTKDGARIRIIPDSGVNIVPGRRRFCSGACRIRIEKENSGDVPVVIKVNAEQG